MKQKAAENNPAEQKTSDCETVNIRGWAEKCWQEICTDGENNGEVGRLSNKRSPLQPSFLLSHNETTGVSEGRS